MLDDTPKDLNDLWNDLNTIIQEACAGRNLDAIRDGIVELRSDYKQRDLRGAPNFDSPEKRLAYAVAYHAPHAYCYLDLLSRQQFGPKLFASMQRPLNVLVLGAGIGAETLAMLRWLRAENCTWFRGSQLTLVDRAPWADTRRLILEPMIRDLIKFFELGIRQVRRFSMVARLQESAQCDVSVSGHDPSTECMDQEQPSHSNVRFDSKLALRLVLVLT